MLYATRDWKGTKTRLEFSSMWMLWLDFYEIYLRLNGAGYVPGWEGDQVSYEVDHPIKGKIITLYPKQLLLGKHSDFLDFYDKWQRSPHMSNRSPKTAFFKSLLQLAGLDDDQVYATHKHWGYIDLENLIPAIELALEQDRPVGEILAEFFG